MRTKQFLRGIECRAAPVANRIHISTLSHRHGERNAEPKEIDRCRHTGRSNAQLLSCEPLSISEGNCSSTREKRVSGVWPLSRAKIC